MSGWTWEYDGYLRADERLRESLCTTGNGYFAIRGALPECTADDVHYPGTYAAGCYNRIASDVAGHRVENEDMVNLPNWLPLRFRLPGGDRFTSDTSTVLHHRQVLHLATGLLERRTRFALSDGAVLCVRQQRLVHMADPHLAALDTVWSGCRHRHRLSLFERPVRVGQELAKAGRSSRVWQATGST